MAARLGGVQLGLPARRARLDWTELAKVLRQAQELAEGVETTKHHVGTELGSLLSISLEV